jgi:hypothetical protein
MDRRSSREKADIEVRLRCDLSQSQKQSHAIIDWVGQPRVAKPKLRNRLGNRR